MPGAGDSGVDSTAAGPVSAIFAFFFVFLDGGGEVSVDGVACAGAPANRTGGGGVGPEVLGLG